MTRRSLHHRSLHPRTLPARHVFVTGATGLVGGEALAGLLRQNPALHATVLVRDGARWNRIAQGLRIAAARVTPMLGDVTRPGLGLSPLE